jgi:magnesium transporter
MNKPVIDIIRKDFAKLSNNITVQQALDVIREKGLGEKIVCFYVVDNDDYLVGVVPTRRLLTAQ